MPLSRCRTSPDPFLSFQTVVCVSLHESTLFLHQVKALDLISDWPTTTAVRPAARLLMIQLYDPRKHQQDQNLVPLFSHFIKQSIKNKS